MKTECNAPTVKGLAALRERDADNRIKSDAALKRLNMKIGRLAARVAALERYAGRRA